MDKQSTTRFNRAPVITKRRTRFDLSHPILTTFNTGEFVPIFAEPVYPGETHSLKTSTLTRLETSLHQTMDNAYLEFAFFFVPLKCVWANFDKFLGANDDAWSQTHEYHIPQIYLSGEGDATSNVETGSLLHHLMFPVGEFGGQDSLTFDSLPLKSVFKVWNDWYRDENYDSIIYFDDGDNDVFLDSVYLLNGSYFNPSASNLHVNRFKDLFSTALPAPQKSQEVTLSLADYAPLVTRNERNAFGDIDLVLYNGDGDNAQGNLRAAVGILGTDGNQSTNLAEQITGTNLVTDLTKASSITINQLRLSIAAQAIAERDARGGTRMKEKIYSTWGVHVNDLEIDRSEFLGGKRIPVSMMEVLQTSETGTTVLGTDAGHSKTVDSSESFVRSFTQYGWILGFCYVRTSRNYSQGVDRKFRNKDIYSLFDPMLDNIGELGIENSELYVLDASSKQHNDEAREIFGYQEAWYHLKERTGRFSGYFQPGINGTLDSWHYGDDYDQIPSASAAWLKEGAENVDRTIAVQSNAAFQWSANIYFEYYATRTMAKYSIPNTFGF